MFVDKKMNLVNSVYQLLLGIDPNIELDEEESKTFEDILINLNNIENLIKENLVNYEYERLYTIDRAIIINCLYEIIYLKVDYKKAINKYIDITKTYSDLDDSKQHKFTNKLLDNIVTSLKLK